METTLLSPRLPVAASLTFGELADAYMLAYSGRDPSRAYRVAFWKSLLGTLPVREVSADHIDAGVAQLENSPARTFMGRRTDGSPIYRPRKGPMRGCPVCWTIGLAETIRQRYGVTRNLGVPPIPSLQTTACGHA